MKKTNNSIGNSFEISIKPLSQNKKFFVFRNKKYPINFNLFKINSQYFYRYQKQYENIELIDIFQGDEKEKFNDISDTAISNFIFLCQNETCKIENSDLFYIEYLAHKFEVTALIEIINNIISKNPTEFIFDRIIFKIQHSCLQNCQTDYNSNFSDEDAKIIASDLIEYIKDDRIFNFPISILYQILSEYAILNHNQPKSYDSNISITQANENNINENNNYTLKIDNLSQIIDFLFKCLDKFGKDASILFSLIDFNKYRKEVIKKLSYKYPNTFDFNLIGTKLLKFALEMDHENSQITQKRSIIVLEITNSFEIPLNFMKRQSQISREKKQKEQNNDLNIKCEESCIHNENPVSSFDFSFALIIEVPNNETNDEEDQVLLNFPKGIKRIDDYEFANDQTITEIIIPSSVKLIGDFAFSGCSLLKKAIIPISVQLIGFNAFNGCPKLKEITK